MLNKTGVIPSVKELNMENFQVCAALDKAFPQQLSAPSVLKHLLPTLALAPLVVTHQG